MTMFVNLNIVSASDFAQLDDRPALLADHAERDREDDAEDDDLQHVALGHRLDDRLGHDVEQDLIPGLRLARRSRTPAHGRLTPTPGFMRLTATSPMTSASVVTISK